MSEGGSERVSERESEGESERESEGERERERETVCVCLSVSECVWVWVRVQKSIAQCTTVRINFFPSVFCVTYGTRTQSSSASLRLLARLSFCSVLADTHLLMTHTDMRNRSSSLRSAKSWDR